MAVSLDSRRSVSPSAETSNVNDLNTAAKVDGLDLDSLRRSSRGGTPSEAPEIKRPQLLADVSVVEAQRGRDFDRFAAQIANPTSGVGGAAKMMMNIPSAADWATRPAVDAFGYNEFSNQIDPGDKAAKNLAWKIANSPKALGIDEMLKMSIDSVQSTYGNRDTTSACVVLANVLKRATGAERADRIEAGNPAMKGSVLSGDVADRALYRAVNNKLEDYRGDGSPAVASNDIYYHSATVGAIYKGGGAGVAALAAAVENLDTSQADDVIEGNAQLQLTQKLGLRSVINLR